MAQYKNAIITTFIRSHDKTSAYELGKLVWPQVKDNLSEQRQQVLSELDKALDERKVASGVIEAGVW